MDNTEMDTTSNTSAYSYTKVLDARKQPIRGLWMRNNRFLARITVEDDAGRKAIKWVPLENATTKQPVRTMPEAKAALEKLKGQRHDNQPPHLHRISPTGVGLILRKCGTS